MIGPALARRNLNILLLLHTRSGPGTEEQRNVKKTHVLTFPRSAVPPFSRSVWDYPKLMEGDM